MLESVMLIPIPTLKNQVTQGGPILNSTDTVSNHRAALSAKFSVAYLQRNDSGTEKTSK
jgi:hypothetical protein